MGCKRSRVRSSAARPFSTAFICGFFCAYVVFKAKASGFQLEMPIGKKGQYQRLWNRLTFLDLSFIVSPRILQVLSSGNFWVNTKVSGF